MIGAYLTKKANNTKRAVITIGKFSIACAGGYVTYRAVSFVKDRMLGAGSGTLVAYLLYKKLN